MKKIHTINKWAYCITLVLYLTLYLGLIAQIILGAIQIILAIFLLIRYRKDDAAKDMLSLYAILTLFYFLVSFTLIKSNVDNHLIAYLFMMILPMSIGGYFLFVTSQLNKKYNNHAI